MTEPAPTRRNWPRIWALLGLSSGALAAVGAYGSGFGFWHFTIGFLMIAVALLLAIIAIIGGAITILRSGRTLLLSAGIVVALGLCAIIGNQIYRGTQAPPIHDISTDLANPPQFETLTPRADLYAGLAGGRDEWRRLHQQAYGDIRPVRLNLSFSIATEAVQQLVEARGWEIATPEFYATQIEATDTVSPFRFKDDIIITLTPSSDNPEQGTTLVNIRSVSRVGISDLGVNARRVRALIADINAIQY